MCSCPHCRNQETAQRQINVFKMNADECAIRNVTASETQGKLMYDVEFGDGHHSMFPASLLTDRLDVSTRAARGGFVLPSTWRANIADDPPSVAYADIQAGAAGLARLLLQIRRFGFAFVDEMPAIPEATEALLNSVGPIRNTHYGAFYDFTSDLSSKDTAYTAEALEPHTDNTYFTEAAGLQALHMLSHTDGSGGESSLVDGFGAAAQLYHEDWQAYRLLSRTGVHAHASGNEGISIQPAQSEPLLSHHAGMGYLMQVRWNNADRAGVATSLQHMDKWYEAAAKFDAIVSDPKNQYWFQLKPGRMLRRSYASFMRRRAGADNASQSSTIGVFCMVEQPSPASGGCVVVTVSA